MQTTEIIFHLIVIFMATGWFLMKVNGIKDPLLYLIIQIFLKSTSLFCIFYSGIKLCKYFGLI